MRTIAEVEKLVRGKNLDKPKPAPQLVMEDAVIGEVRQARRSSAHLSRYGRRAIVFGLAVLIAILGTALFLHTDEPLSVKAEALKVGVFMPLGIVLGSILMTGVLVLLQRILSMVMVYGLIGVVLAVEILALMLV